MITRDSHGHWYPRQSLVVYLFISGAMVLTAFVFFLLSQNGRGASTQKIVRGNDRQALIDLENYWLEHEHDPSKLETILASDFVHPVPTGDFLNKTQHIFYSSKYLPPANLKNRFGDLNVRLYGDVGIVDGIVITRNEKGVDVNKTIFTDVFVFRDGRWQAINAQENRVENRPKQ